MALRKVLRPFLKAVHPDVLHHHASATVKRTNEQSLQQLNTILDTLEHLGQGKPQNPQQHSLEPSYELTFHLITRSSSGKTKAKSAAAASPLPLAAPFSPTDTAVAAAAAAEARTAPAAVTAETPHTFTARLTFPSTTITRYARAAPLSSSSTADTDTTAPTPILQLPREISQQLRKLFQGARLKIPKELESSHSHTNKHTHSRHRRSNYITTDEANDLLLADLMTRDLRVDGPSHTQRQAAVSRLLRSGRVMTKGLSPPEEAVALCHLEEVLVGEWERGNLGDVSPSIQILLDADSERIHWEVLSSPPPPSSAGGGEGGGGRGREVGVGGGGGGGGGGGRRHLLICPADVKGSRFRLASILRMIGKKEQEEEGGRGGGGAAGSFFASSSASASSERKQGEGRRQYRRAAATPSSSEGICVEPFYTRRGKDLDVHVGRF